MSYFRNSLKAFTDDRLIVVDPQGSDTYGEGTLERPYQTIAHAITAALALDPVPSTANPVAIYLNPGTYAEHVTLENRGISFYGYGQFISQIKRAGTALTIKDNGVDDCPWDVKIVGISLQSTDAGAYALSIEGVAGSSLGGNEIHIRDGAILGTKSVYCNLANYIDYQNVWIQGAQDYSQTSGIWIEHSQHDGQITDDWDDAGSKPSDGSHYGLNLSSARLAVEPNFVNAGAYGDYYRTVEPYASKIDNDSSYPGTTVKDAFDNVVARIDTNGFFKPVSSDDASAPNDSIYYSTTQSKLVYKDSGGTVHDLHA
jgi:hypothetical protein